MPFLVSAWMAMTAGSEPPPSTFVISGARVDGPETSLFAAEPYASVTAIPLEDTRASVSSTAAQVATVPGAFVQESGGLGQRASVSLRGASSDATLVLLDGIPISSPGLAADLSRISSSALREIEVLRGSGSRLGIGAMAGALALQTRDLRAHLSLAGRLSIGSFGSQIADATATVPLGKGGLLVSASAINSRGDFSYSFNPTPRAPNPHTLSLVRRNNDARQGNVLLKYGWQFSETQLDFTFFGDAFDRGLAGTVENPQASSRQRAVNGLLAARSATRLKTGGRLVLTAHGKIQDATIIGGQFGLQDPFHQSDISAAAEGRYLQKLDRHSFGALLSVGGDWLREPTTKNPAWARFSAAGSDDVSFASGRLVTGISARLDVAGKFVVGSPELGAALQLNADWTVRASVGLASRVPSFAELYVRQGTTLANPDLVPERGIGGNCSIAFERAFVRASASGYATSFTNLITYEYYPGGLAKPYNFAGALVAGAEVEMSASPWRWIQVRVAYGYLKTINTSADPRFFGKPLPFRPEHRGSARLQAGIPQLLFVFEAALQTEQAVNRAATVTFPGRAILNARVTSKLMQNPTVILGIEVKNLQDTQAQDFDGYPISPRAGFLTLAVSWEGVS